MRIISWNWNPLIDKHLDKVECLRLFQLFPEYAAC
ncbi:MAG: hypothetical protein RI897_2420 [Verrucomicrobiota bacterium]